MKKFLRAFAVACLACWPLEAARKYFEFESYSAQDMLLQLGWAPARVFFDLILLDDAYALLKGRPLLTRWPWHLAPRALALELSFTARLAMRFTLGLLPLAGLAAYLSGSGHERFVGLMLWALGPLGAALLGLYALRRLCAPMILLYQGLDAAACLDESQRLSRGSFWTVLLPLGALSLGFGALEEFGADLVKGAAWILGPLAALGSAWAVARAYTRLLSKPKST